MKKLLTLTAVGVILSAPAHAVQRCVQPASSAQVDNDPNNTYYGMMDWDMYTNIGYIRGVAGCGTKTSTVSTLGTTAQLPVTYDNTLFTSNNKYCYCKMTYPVVSKWVYVTYYASSLMCYKSCAHFCAIEIPEHAMISAYLDTIFSELSGATVHE